MMNEEKLKELTLGRDMDALSATDVVNWAFDTFKKDFILSCGFSADDMVLMDMLHRIKADVEIAVVDSGRLFSETYEFIDAVIDKYHPRLSFYFPESKKLKKYLAGNGPNAFRLDHKLRLECCEIRRHEPLKQALKNRKAWMAGLRRSQSGAREEVKKVALDTIHPGIVKICPLADWSWEQLWAYSKEHSVPMHPLYAKGYMSIGCAPCSRPSPSGDERAGRWWWEPANQREDGVHFIL